MTLARPARSLDVLLGQINKLAPQRSKVSDGWIGDAAHQITGSASDHNPWWPKPGGGIVTARDITHDPAGGMDCTRLAAALVASRDRRIKYLIWSGRILDTRPEFSPWTWRPYHGASPHDHHLHISVIDTTACEDTSPWALPMLTATNPRRAEPEDTTMRVETPAPTDPKATKKDWPTQWVSFGFDPPKGWGGAGVVKITTSAPGGWVHEAAWWRRKDTSTPVGVPNQPHERVTLTVPGGPELFPGYQRELQIPERCDELELRISAPGGAHFAAYYER